MTNNIQVRRERHSVEKRIFRSMNRWLLSIFTLLIVCIVQPEMVFSQRPITKDPKTGSSIAVRKSAFNRIVQRAEFLKQRDILQADSLASILIQKSKYLGPTEKCKAAVFAAEMAEVNGDQSTSIQLLKEVANLMSRRKADALTVRYNQQLARTKTSQLAYKEADDVLRTTLNAANRIRKNAAVALTYNLLAINFMHQNQKDSALFYTERAIRYARRTSQKEVLAECFNKQGQIYAYFGQVDLSMAKNINALQIATDLNNAFLMASYNRELGISQRSILNLEDAETYFNRSLENAKSVNDRRQIGLAMMGIGSIYYDRNRLKDAIQLIEQAKSKLSKVGDGNGLGEVHNNLGLIYRRQQQYNQAASNFNKALVYFESTGNREKIAAVYHNVGTVFKQQKRYANALNYLNRSVSIRKEFGSKNQLYSTYLEIANVYKETGRIREALNYLEKYVNFTDSNSVLQSATKLAELNESYQSDQRERLISLQRDSIDRQRQEKALTATKLENSQLKNNFQTYVIIGFVIIVILALIIFYTIWSQNRIKQQQREAEMSQTLLRAQMNPHFVFNAMSVIQSYIYENDTVNSSKFLVNFSRLMRLILENSSKEFIPIDTEIEILQKYLETQKLRFEERFDFRIDVSEDILIEHAVIPPMITQPFIENAIEHGQLHTIEGGRIEVSFKKIGNMMEISIIDNGIGRKGSKSTKKSKAHKSMAMAITRERIENLNKKYKTDGQLIVEDYDQQKNTGTKIVISLPYKEDNINTFQA